MVWLGIVLVAAVLAYLPMFKASFLNFDDEIYITENPLIRNLDRDNLKALFSTIYQNQYAPVAMLIMALEFKVFGASPQALKAVSLVVHLANTLLVFQLIRQLFRRFDYAIVTAGLFALHPLQVESVAWLTASMKIGAYSLFFLGSLVAYVQYLNRKTPGWFVFSLVLFLWSCLSKEQAIVLPAALLAIDYVRERPLLSRTVILEKVPFVVLALAFAIVTLTLTNKPQNEDVVVSYSLMERLVFASYSSAASVLKLILPIHLSAFYTHPVTGSIPAYYFATPFLAILVAGALLISLKKGIRIIVFGIGFFLANIFLPFMSQLLSARDVMMADRYVYLSAIGFFVIAAYALGEWTRRQPQLRTMVWAALLSYGAVLTVLTCQRTQVWENSITLFSDVIQKERRTPGSSTSFLVLAHNNRGIARKRSGDREGALADFNQAIAINPNDARPWLSRANLLFDAGQFEAAIRDYEKVLQWDSKNAKAYSSRGAAHAAQNRFEPALKDLNRAIELDSMLADAFANRAQLYAEMKRFAEALADLDRYLQLKPDDADIINSRAVTLADLNRLAEAEAEFNRAIQLNPRMGAFYFNRSRLYKRTGRKAQALEDVQRAQSLGVSVDRQYLDSLR